MDQILWYAGTLALATAVTWYATPLFRQAALRFGIVDAPNTALKVQQEPVPYLGGLAVYVGFLTAVAALYRLDQEVLGVLLAGTLVLMLGLVDDFGVLTPKVKLGFQIAIVLMLMRAGIYIRLEFLPQWLALVLTGLWVVGLTNALNLIDIMDGLATGVAAVIALALFLFALWCGREMVALMAIALAGACLGFLVFNRAPARIYLGDAGSMFLGMMLSTLAINKLVYPYQYCRRRSPPSCCSVCLCSTPCSSPCSG